MIAVLFLTTASWDNTIVWDTGKAKIDIAELGIFPDTFMVVFDEPLRTNDYQVLLQGNSAHIEEVWDDGGLFGYGKISKDCYITEKTTMGFKGLCNWKLYLTSMAYGEMGEYASIFHLKQDYTIIGVSDEAYMIDWLVTIKEPTTRLR